MIKEMKRVFAFFLVGILLINLCIISAQTTSKKPYNVDDIETWYSSSGNFFQFKGDLADPAKLEKINSKIQASSLSSQQREYIMKRVLKYYPDFDKISLKGLGSKDLKFSLSAEGKMVIGDGKVFLNPSKKLPDWVSEVEYVAAKDIPGSKKGLPSSLVFKDKSGGKVVMQEGSLNEKGEIDGVKGYEGVKPILSGKDQVVTVFKGDTGTSLILEKGAKISSNGLEFSQDLPNRQAYLIKDDDKHFEAMNIVMSRGDINVKVPDGRTTDILLGDGTSNNPGQYVRVNNEKINLVGNGIEVDLLKDSKIPYKITAEGNGLIVKNEKITYEINGEETRITRNTGDYKDLHPFELRNALDTDKMVYSDKFFAGQTGTSSTETKPGETQVAQTTTETKPAETQSKVSVTDEKTGKSFVQIGDEQVMQKKAWGTTTDVMRSRFGIDKSAFDNIPQNMNDEQFQKWLLSTDKKMEVTPTLDIGALKMSQSGRGEGRNNLDGRDLYDGFMAGPPEMKEVTGFFGGKSQEKVDPAARDEPGKLYNWEQQGLKFPTDERQALDTMLRSALTDSSGNWRKFPPGSKFYISSGDNPEITILQNQGTLAQPKLVEVYRQSVTDPAQIKAVNRNFEYGLTSQDNELKKETSGKYTRNIDRVRDAVNAGKCNRNVCF